MIKLTLEQAKKIASNQDIPKNSPYYEEAVKVILAHSKGSKQ